MRAEIDRRKFVTYVHVIDDCGHMETVRLGETLTWKRSTDHDLLVAAALQLGGMATRDYDHEGYSIEQVDTDVRCPTCGHVETTTEWRRLWDDC